MKYFKFIAYVKGNRSSRYLIKVGGGGTYGYDIKDAKKRIIKLITRKNVRLKVYSIEKV